MTKLYTIGHSNHTAAKFFSLLENYDISILVDVRSVPYSKYTKWAKKAELTQLCIGRDIEYIYMGNVLGGKDIDYHKRSSELDFIEALSRLMKIVKGKNAVLMCAEEDPNRCHRQHLLAKILKKNNDFKCEIEHIRADGNTEKPMMFLDI